MYLVKHTLGMHSIGVHIFGKYKDICYFLFYGNTAIILTNLES